MEQITIKRSEDAKPRISALTRFRTILTLVFIFSAGSLNVTNITIPDGKERNCDLGIFLALLSAGFAARSISGGVLTAAFGWSSVLFVNVPIGVVAAILSQKFLVNHPGRAMDKHLDLPGALTVTSGLVLLVYALTNVATDGFLSVQTILPLGLSVLLLAGFLAIEHRSPSPLMPLSFLRRGTVLTPNVLALLLTPTAVEGVCSLSTFLQQGSRYSALDAGLEFVPAPMIFFFVGGWRS